MTVRLDYTNMMADVVGEEHGLRDVEIAGLAPTVAEIHADLHARRKQGMLPFFDLPFREEMMAECQQLGDEFAERFDNLLVLGIGGSALGTTALFRALVPLQHNLLTEKQRSRPRLFVADNVDPAGFSELLNFLDPNKTGVCVISKSGTTVETSCQFMVVQAWMRKAVGNDWRDRFVLVTDPAKGALRPLATRESIRALAIPDGVGGRFSVLTPVGLMPLATVGVPLQRLMAGARSMAERATRPELETNPAYLNAVLQFLAYQKGLHISVMMPYSDRLRDVADWYRQLWAESLGKKFSIDGETVHVGPTPVKALGTTDQHSQVQLYMEGPHDKVVTFLTVDDFGEDVGIPPFPEAGDLDYLIGQSMADLIKSEQRATALALCKNGRPNCALRLSTVSPESLGELIYLFEVQTLCAGGLFRVDPLDQPGVEEGKLLTYGLMKRPGFEEKRAEVEDWEGGVNLRQL